MLNGQTSEWLPVKAGVPQGSVLGSLLFLVYINDLSENIESTLKLFADDAFLFSVVHNNKTSAEVLNRDLQKISEWAHKWKMSFNPDISKQAHEVIFSRKQAISVHPDLVLNNMPFHQTHCQKHLGIYIFRNEIKFQTTSRKKSQKQ